MKRLSPDDLLNRMEWRREIRNIMGNLSHDYAVKQESQAFDRYWTKEHKPCLGINSGYYVGRDAVAGYYSALGEEIRITSDLIQSQFPKELGALTSEDVYGVGMMTYLPFDSHVIEIAEDEQTAKGMWNIRGSYSYLTPSGPVANWTYGWAAADFIREDGQWKIWHLLLLYNVDHQCGVPFCGETRTYPEVPGFAPIAEFSMPIPTVPCTVMETFYPARIKNQSPEVPVPYTTFSDTFSYGI